MIYDVFLLFLCLEVKANVYPMRMRGPYWPYLGLNSPILKHRPIGMPIMRPHMPLYMPHISFMPVFLLPNDASSSRSSGSFSSEGNDNLHLSLEDLKSRKNVTKLIRSLSKKSKFVEHISKKLYLN